MSGYYTPAKLVNYVTISGNKGYNGGAVSVTSTSSFHNYGCIKENTAVEYGGGGCVGNSGSVFINHGSISYN